ncbi:hypothetical protein H6P81_011218 [Aristolochia fimbriata]|uniref:Ran guanine nucleotide release factor n=1 Tax=Aristolochia fimbriata TaxID=158543 RepID=A0AAV7EQX2_ARIFI|nr:hypothetical protein H6P81_011218 [Aristolochia fimbriata]
MGESCVDHPLFGGALSSAFPLRFQDLSTIRDVPNNQEAFADPNRDESIIFELLDLKNDVHDAGSAVWFLQDLATEQDADEGVVLEYTSTTEEVAALRYRDIPAILSTAIGQMAISKGRQGREAQNIVRVYLANVRLKGVGTDVLIAAYEPILINPLSESAQTVGAGLATPAIQMGSLPMSEVFKTAVSSFRVHQWSLFGSGA